MDAGLNVSSVCIHRGEEPVISGSTGICNIFFGGCNLKCIYCQNHQISQPVSGSYIPDVPPEVVLGRIEEILRGGISRLGFVSPSHLVPQVKWIIRQLNERGLHPVTVYNTNGYDKQDTLRSLEGMIDIWLPDFKYLSPSLASEYSGAADYPSVALKAIREMYYQKGSVLQTDDEGCAVSGLLIRHLVLPGHAGESIRVLETIADELSPGVHVSLMSQYHPGYRASGHPEIGRPLSTGEYRRVADAMERLGFRNGYLQEPESSSNYRPDFSRDHPFEY
jgi:putative pyruvate formate lyase activating enzyme